MTRRIRFRPEADAEIQEARQWYDLRVPGLGDAILLGLDATLSAIERNPFAYPIVYGAYRRAVMRRFPYGVFYMVTDDEIIVMAFFHGRRDPKQLMARSV